MDKASIDALFSALTVAYGTRFRDQWQGQDPLTVKRHWAAELERVNPRKVAWALRNLPPDFPPTAMQFKALCRQAPSPYEQALGVSYSGMPAPPELAAKLAQVGQGNPDHLAWAKALKAREESGERLSPTLRSMWREALRHSSAECSNADESTT